VNAPDRIAAAFATLALLALVVSPAALAEEGGFGHLNLRSRSRRSL